ncbi:uncharacterized protein LOC126745837 [Anthonomus grandis grandis]|uniref:uncharacterized protein LOC126745837 n=1 Tax=Anthonomus grandis grandis TaxID=2921223 RepID=UPI0021659EC6|nr:uncharacterized protein LOC126745837 [Anthonomus grandis grandis]
MAFVQLLVTSLLILVTKADVAIDIENASSDVYWIGILANPGLPIPSNGGFVLNGGQTTTVSVPDNWVGRFWARTGCDSGTNTCQTGDCRNGVECAGNGGAPPVTLVEITIKGDGGQDFYDISLVDGFNVKASIQPIDGTGDCSTAECESDVNAACPEQLKDGDYACYSSCAKFNTDQYCCRNELNFHSLMIIISPRVPLKFQMITVV